MAPLCNSLWQHAAAFSIHSCYSSKLPALCSNQTISNTFNYALLNALHICRRRIYWPPQPDARSPLIELPSKKKCFVFNAKREQDGLKEPVLCIVDNQYNRLLWLNEEELLEFEKLIGRIRSYYQLWQQKQKEQRIRLAEKQQRDADPIEY